MQFNVSFLYYVLQFNIANYNNANEGLDERSGDPL